MICPNLVFVLVPRFAAFVCVWYVYVMQASFVFLFYVVAFSVGENCVKRFLSGLMLCVMLLLLLGDEKLCLSTPIALLSTLAFLLDY